MSDHAARSLKLQSRVVSIAALKENQTFALFNLFARYYADVDQARFLADLASKDFVLLLECAGQLVGFSTARLFPFEWQGQTISVIFSGDTVVERAYWGEQELARGWLAQVGRISANLPADRRLVWLLIVKGHRTFRYLPVFANCYVPNPLGEEWGDLLGLRDALCADVFGNEFDQATGVIHFGNPQGRLLPCWAEPSPREAGLADVAWFLGANPGFREGDELACLCDLSPENMRPRALRWFREGQERG